MDRDIAIEKKVSDAITQKPVHFSIKYTERQEVEVTVKEKQPIHRLLPFCYKTVEKIVTETRDVELERKFCIAPATLGKLQILASLYLTLEIDEVKLQEEPHTEIMRTCEKHTDVIARFIAVAVSNTKEDLLDEEVLVEKTQFFKWNCLPRDFADVVLTVLVQVDYENFTISMRSMKLLRQNKPKELGANHIE